MNLLKVRAIGVEPTWIAPADPKSAASANFATPALPIKSLQASSSKFPANLDKHPKIAKYQFAIALVLSVQRRPTETADSKPTRS